MHSIYHFRHDDNGEATEIKMLDLQIVRRSRPAADLNYFFGSSVSPEFRDEHLEEMLSFYHGNLTQSLEVLGYSAQTIFTLENLKQEYQECHMIGFIMGAMHINVREKKYVTCVRHSC